MTDVTPNPNARYERLYRRAQEVHEMVSRLVDDLREANEGKGSAMCAQDDLSELCLILEGKVNAGQQSSSQLGKDQ